MSDPNQQMWAGFSRANALNPAQRHRWRLVISEVPLEAPIVVDLGCGSGLLLSQLRGVRRIGIDVEPRAIELAKKNDPGAEFVVADLQGVDVPADLEGQASVVVCSEVLEHLPHPERAVAFARRLLRPDGRFVITVPSGTITPFDESIGHLRHYTPESLRALLTAAGFRAERIYRWGFPFHSLFRAAMSLAPQAANLYRDDRLSWPARAAWKVMDWLFYLNLPARRLGRQLVAVAQPE